MYWLRLKGINSEETILAGLNYASTLWNVNCRIEAERLTTTLSTVSHRVHGPHHNTTIRVDEIFDRCKERFVIYDNKAYQVCAKKMMEKYVSSKDHSYCQGMLKMRGYIVSRSILYGLLKAVQ